MSKSKKEAATRAKSNPGNRFRLTSPSGHMVILFALDAEHANSRWAEFYPELENETREVVEL